jgi:pyruvate/2-oxoglutarate dehydrogenase complex dihydrolipoamide acyltransferase (E2) component
MATIRIQIENGDVKISLGTSGKETITLDTENAVSAAAALPKTPPKKAEKTIAPPASAAPASAAPAPASAKRKPGRPRKGQESASPKNLATQIEERVRAGELPKETFSRGDVCQWFAADKRHASAAIKSLVQSGLLGMRGERATAVYFPRQEAWGVA